MNGFGDRDISHYMIPLCGTLSIADLGSIAHPMWMCKQFFYAEKDPTKHRSEYFISTLKKEKWFFVLHLEKVLSHQTDF